MARTCPYCESEMSVPRAETLTVEEFVTGIDVDESARRHVQLECPSCAAVLGYLGLAAATGGADLRGYM